MPLIEANGTQIYVEETGTGPPLVLLHGATVSTSEVWIDFPWSWRPHVPRFAEHFRVVAMDTRGHGKTPSPDGAVSYETFAEDIEALIEALGLDRPMLCGFSDGGHAATLVAMRKPDLPSAIVNYAGYDLFNHEAPSMEVVRTRQGGSAEATGPNFERLGERIGPDRMRLIEEDHTPGQGDWKKMFESGFHRWTQPGKETFEDFKRITAPTLIQVGDRDPFCTVEEGVEAFRLLPEGELSIVPGVDHSITAATVDAAIEFLLRHQNIG